MAENDKIMSSSLVESIQIEANKIGNIHKAELDQKQKFHDNIFPSIENFDLNLLNISMPLADFLGFLYLQIVECPIEMMVDSLLLEAIICSRGCIN